jgi:hypothetical protein
MDTRILLRDYFSCLRTERKQRISAEALRNRKSDRELSIFSNGREMLTAALLYHPIFKIDGNYPQAIEYLKKGANLSNKIFAWYLVKKKNKKK